MLWFKMPKNLDKMGISPKDVGLVAEILYFANSQTGEINLKSRSIMSKYLKTTREYYVIISLLCRNQVVNKGSKKGQYFYNVNWDSENTLKTKCKQDVNNLKTTCNTLTIDKKRIDNIHALSSIGCEQEIEIIKTDKKNEDQEFVKQVINYLNEKTNKKFTHNNKKTISLINARRRENHDLNAFKRVIDTKTRQWVSNANMVGFLRPQTLFSNNFESYLNEESENDKKNHMTLLLDTEQDSELMNMSAEDFFNHVKSKVQNERD